MCARFIKDGVMSVIYLKKKCQIIFWKLANGKKLFMSIPIERDKNRIQKGEVC